MSKIELKIQDQTTLKNFSNSPKYFIGDLPVEKFKKKKTNFSKNKTKTYISINLFISIQIDTRQGFKRCSFHHLKQEFKHYIIDCNLFVYTYKLFNEIKNLKYFNFTGNFLLKSTLFESIFQ